MNNVLFTFRRTRCTGLLPFRALCEIAGLAALLICSPAGAEVLRVATWTADPARGKGDLVADAGPELIARLKQTKPDVLLLQNVDRWETCTRLAKVLEPEPYNIGICSAFREPVPTGTGVRQVAILSKIKPYFSWSEAWRGPALSQGGFGFVALQKGRQRVGLFSAAFRRGTNAVSSALQETRQLREQINQVKNWVTNRAETFVIAAIFPPASRVEMGDQVLTQLLEAGFGSVVSEARNSSDPNAALVLHNASAYVLKTEALNGAGQDEVLVADLEVDPAIVAQHQAELEQQAAKEAEAARIARAQAQVLAQTQAQTQIQAQARTEALAPAPATAIPAPAANYRNFPWFLASAAAAALAVVLAVVWQTRKRKRHRSGPTALLPQHAEGAVQVTVVVAPRSATGSGSEPAPTLAQGQPVMRVETPESAPTQSAAWRERALAAEARADQATRVVEQGLMPQFGAWLKQKLVLRLVSDRAALMKNQDAATQSALNVNERLQRIEKHIQLQNQGYEHRIAELTKELQAAKAENRELIQTRIRQVRAEMEAARARMLREAQLSDPPPEA